MQGKIVWMIATHAHPSAYPSVHPAVLYHGSPTPEGVVKSAEFVPGGTEGSQRCGDSYGVATYLTTCPSEASFYAKDTGAVFPVRVSGHLLDIDCEKLCPEDADRLTVMAAELLLPSDKARFDVGRLVKSFDTVDLAREFFDSQSANWKAFGDKMDRARPHVLSAKAGHYEIEYTDFDAPIRIETGQHAFTLFRAVGWGNVRAAGFDGLVMSRESGAKWVVMHNTQGTIVSNIGDVASQPLIDTEDDITEQACYQPAFVC